MHMQFCDGSLQQLTAMLCNRIIVGTKDVHKDLKNLRVSAMLLGAERCDKGEETACNMLYASTNHKMHVEDCSSVRDTVTCTIWVQLSMPRVVNAYRAAPDCILHELL